jgi:hypothetical protein
MPPTYVRCLSPGINLRLCLFKTHHAVKRKLCQEIFCQIRKCFKLLAHDRTAMTLTSPLLCMRPGFKPLLTSSPLLHTLTPPPRSFEFQTHFLLFSQQSPTIDSPSLNHVVTVYHSTDLLFLSNSLLRTMAWVLCSLRSLTRRKLYALQGFSIKLHNMSAVHKASIKSEEIEFVSSLQTHNVLTS